ncbi:OLC1v1008016C1 [Oldenlandia corymbosa var. corymbosa]|uniref:OLC1v1008016C1 n=1 Tax=Oldenlandia corymbosa var. corymbosa TaxID=529605 RepID=A0AAV1DKP4_OLDCO|nr:OLC1v1008016C1 [Oldenlandia corymbosa var. corymbosa]
MEGESSSPHGLESDNNETTGSVDGDTNENSNVRSFVPIELVPTVGMESVDDILQGAEILVEEEQVMQNEELAQSSNLDTDLEVINIGKAKGIKVRPKPTSSKRLKSGLEKNASFAYADTHKVHMGTSEHNFAANPATSTMRMTDLLMAQQIPDFNQSGIGEYLGEKQFSGFDNFGIGDNLGSVHCDEKCGCSFQCLGGICCTCRGNDKE